MRLGWIFLFLVTQLWAEPSYLTFPSDIDWKSLKSPHFEIIYREGQKPFALRTLRAAEKAHRLLNPLFPEIPFSTFIVLADFHDSLNGYSLNFPYTHFVIFAVPPESTSELAALDNWLDSVVLHEYVHTLHLFPATGAWKWLRTIFGSWVVPNGMLPSHLHEGLATFLETEFTQGGRGRGSYFSMFTRKAVESGNWESNFYPLDLLDGAPSLWPQGTSPYYFGYYLYESLWKAKKQKGIYDLTLTSSRNLPYFVNSPFQEVYGKDLPSLWKSLKESISQKTLVEIEQIKKTPLSALHYLTHTLFYKKEVHLSPSGRELLFMSASPKQQSGIETLELESGKRLGFYPLNLSGASGFCWKQNQDSQSWVLSTTENQNLYSINRLQTFNPQTKQSAFLKTRKGLLGHIHQFDCSKNFDRLFVYQESAGTGEIKILKGNLFDSQASLEEERSWVVPEGAWISSVSLGEIPFFFLRKGTQTHFYKWNKDKSPELLAAWEGHSHHLKTYSERIYFIASMSGRDEVWEWVSKESKVRKVVAVLGGINSFEMFKNSFYVSSYEQGGFDIAQAEQVTSPPQIIQKPSPINESSKMDWPLSEETDYSPLSTLLPRTWIPSALFVNYGLQVGAWIPMFDLSQKHYYDLNVGVDRRETNDGYKALPFVSAEYGYRFGKSFSIQTNAYFLPSFLTITRSFFQRWGASVGLSSNLGDLPIQTRISLLMRKIENSDLGPANQSVGAGLDLGWSSATRTNPLDTTLNEGLRVSASYNRFFQGLGSKDNFFSALINLDGYLPSPLWSSATWYLGLHQGYTEGTPLYNSFFEGGGELLFSQGRGIFLNRGYLQGSFAARRIFGGNLELRFPISQIDRGLSLWPVFLQSLSGAVVLDTTSFDFGIPSRAPKSWLKQFLWSTGVELKSQWKFFYYLPTQIRLGAYRGLSSGGEDFYFTTAVEASL
jgi:hypothetical protein